VITGARGKVVAKTSYAKLSIEAQDALVDAANSNGSIIFTGSLAKGDHRFQTTGAGVTVTLPAAQAFAIDAQTSYAKIRNDFKMAKTEISTDTRLVGAVGEKPQVTVKMSASSGDVVIRRGK
jgi:hypothetical protein